MNRSSVLLLPGVASDGSLSMARYARELFASLNALGENRPTITLDRPVQQRYLTRVLDHHQMRRIDSAWFRYVAYPRSLRRRQAGAFHILDQGYAQLIRRLDPERTIITCHDLVPLLAAEGVIPINVPASVAWSFKWRVGYLARARKVIADSLATKATLERYTSVRSQDIVVVPLGVHPIFHRISTAKSRQRASAGLTAQAPVVLQVATGVRYKNTSVLLHAFAQLRSRLPDVILVRVGAPFFSDEAELARKLDVAGAVRYVGRVDDQTLAEWYNAADVLVFPSLWEGFGWPPLEAMACGTPVVASNIPAIAEVVDDAGILVAADDPSALAGAAERVLTDPILAETLRQKGLERARQYTWARTAERTAAIYDDVLQ